MVFFFFCGKTPFISVKCDDLASIDNGQLAISMDGVSTIAVFTCDIGSTVNGSSTAECSADGSWSVMVPHCGNIIFSVYDAIRTVSR